MPQKSAMTEMIEWLKAYEWEIPLDLILKAEELLKVEHQQIVQSWCDNRDNIFCTDEGDIIDSPEGFKALAQQYYEKTYTSTINPGNTNNGNS